MGLERTRKYPVRRPSPRRRCGAGFQLLRHRLDSQRNYRNNTAAALTIRNAQKTVAEKPEFAGTVKFVETHNFARTKDESPTGETYHEFKNGETYFLIGDAPGKGVKELLPK